MLLKSSSLLLGLGCLCSVASQLTPYILLNAGSTVPYEDDDGNTWDPDVSTDGRVQSDSDGRAIIGTDKPGLYIDFREKFIAQGPLVYNFDLPNGNYTVDLHFSDLTANRIGQRILDVQFNEELVLDDYDAMEVTGDNYIADVQTITPVVIEDGALMIEFSPVLFHTMISAIGIYTGFPPATPSPTMAPTWVPANPEDYQPLVIEVEAYPPCKAQGFIGWPGGTAWCQGRPTYWWIGHDNRPEEPFCEEADGTWTKSSTAILDRSDALNAVDGPAFIDRHDCTAFDANNDGVEDLVCVVGANKGTGYGYNDVYYTNPEDGSITRQMQDVGLYKYPTMRTRLIQNLTAADGGNMVMITTTGGERADLQENEHRLFRLNETNLFDEIPGPFNVATEVVCLEIGDINNDGIDDFITCDLDGPGSGYVQNPDNSWTELDWSEVDESIIAWWNGAKLADVTGDGLTDLIVAGPGSSWLVATPDPYVRVFPGVAGLATVFDFENPTLDDKLPFETMDVETIDLNGDGLLDIYVVQWNLRPGTGEYCHMTWDFRDWWDEDLGHDFPPADFIPPGDDAPDYLYLSRDGTEWDAVTMEHSIPGCGYKAKKWSDNSIAVAHGAFGRPGFNVILEWPPAATPAPSWGEAITEAPTIVPTPMPTSSPTSAPTSAPTLAPAPRSEDPSSAPTVNPPDPQCPGLGPVCSLLCKRFCCPLYCERSKCDEVD